METDGLDPRRGEAQGSLTAWPPQTLVALRRVQALQQHEPRASQNPPAGAPGDQKDSAEHRDQDRKILQLCGEGLAGSRLGRAWRGGALSGRGWCWVAGLVCWAGPT